MQESEATIQSWFEDLCRGDGILPHIVNHSAVADALQQSAAQDTPFSLGQTMREALLRSAHAVLQKLDDVELVTCNQNISCFQDNELKPDLVLMDRDDGAFVIIELKKSHQTARQAITELVAYGQAIEHLYPGAQIALVLVSPDWRSLLDYAVVNQVTAGRRKLLALEIAPCDTSQFSLRVRVDDLLRDISNLVFQPDSLPAETVTFERRKQRWSRELPLEVASAFSTIAREGDRSGGTGFALLLRTQSQYGYQWHITVMALDPFRITVEPDDASLRWQNPIAAFVRGEPWLNGRPPAVDEQEPDPFIDEDFIPWTSGPELPDPGAAMSLIYEIYADVPDSLVRSHDNQKHWAYVQSDPFHGAGVYLAFEAWGLLGDLVRHNGKRFERLDISLLRQGTRRLHWNAPANWVPCIDIVTGDDPLRDNLLTVSSCHALGVAFRTWFHCVSIHESHISRTIANARVIQVMRKIVAIYKDAPDQASELPFVRMRGDTPDLNEAHDFVDWVDEWFFPDRWLRFAFHLGLQVPQQPRYIPPDPEPMAMPFGKEDMLSQVNFMLNTARSLRPKLPPGIYQSNAEGEVETHLQGHVITLDDLVNARLRSYFLEMVSPHFAQFRHPVATPRVLVEV